MRSIFNPLSVFENAVKYGLTVKVTYVSAKDSGNAIEKEWL